jgi:hypothetical protein
LNSSASSIDEPEDFSEEEMKKAEEFKTKGNDLYKGKFLLRVVVLDIN